MTRRPQTVVDLMTREVVTLSWKERVLAAEDVMRLGRIRHLPIVDDDGLLVGIVSQRDLFRWGLLLALTPGGAEDRAALEGVLVKDAMRNDVVTVARDTPLEDAARLMLERKIGCLVVTQGKRILGIITESDFVKLALV